MWPSRRGETHLGRMMEAEMGVSVILQPKYTPEVNALDNSWWKAHEEDMERHVKQWEMAHPNSQFEETRAQIKERSKSTALGMSTASVDSCCAKIVTNLEKLRDADGWYIAG